jgi:hypothetical protein
LFNLLQLILLFNIHLLLLLVLTMCLTSLIPFSSFLFIEIIGRQVTNSNRQQRWGVKFVVSLSAALEKVAAIVIAAGFSEPFA